MSASPPPSQQPPVATRSVSERLRNLRALADEVRRKVLPPTMAPVHAERLAVEVPPADHEFIYVGVGPRILQIERKRADHPVQFGGEGDVLLHGAAGVDASGEALFRGAVVRAELNERLITTHLYEIPEGHEARPRVWWYELFHKYARHHRRRIVIARLARRKATGGYDGVPRVNPQR